MPRFVLLRHDHPTLHWDLMLDAGGALWTWRLEHPPRDGQAQAADRIGDHRTLYLDYEGPVSGGRGEVRREAAGGFEWLTREEGELIVRLDAPGLTGVLALTAGGTGWVAHFKAGRGSADSP